MTNLNGNLVIKTTYNNFRNQITQSKYYWYLIEGLTLIMNWKIINHICQPSARAGYDTRSIFKRSLTGLNSEFSFSKISCLIKAKEPSMPY